MCGCVSVYECICVCVARLGRCFRWRVTALNILGPIADILLRIEDQVGRTWHVMLAFSLAHVIMGTVGPILVVANVSILFRTGHIVGYNN